MSKSKPKHKLTWLGKENSPKLEPCIIMEDPEKSYYVAEMHRELIDQPSL
jgi:adenine-specific DNA-methyltransferase